MGPSELPMDYMQRLNQFRLDDAYLVLMVISSLAFCLVHAARRAFRQPLPVEEAMEAPAKQAVTA